MKEKIVFITVGTTQFNQLVNTVSTPEILEMLKGLGYTIIQFQTGSGMITKVSYSDMTIMYEKYIEDFEKQIEIADLIISHAGAGTCLEVLKKKKSLIVVINDDLMNNHQVELAEQLQADGYLYFCTCGTLKDVLKKDLQQLKVYPKPKALFSEYLEKCMGFV